MLYFLGQPATVIPSLLAAGDGDAVVAAGPNCNGLALPATPPRPWTVYAVRRRPLVAQGLSFATAERDVSLSLSGGTGGVFLRVAAAAARPGVQQMLVVRDPAPRLVPLVGREIALGGRDLTAVQGIELLDLTVMTIPVR